MQLVKTETHSAKAHYGSVKQFEERLKKEYDTFAARMLAFKNNWRKSDPRKTKNKKKCGR